MVEANTAVVPDSGGALCLERHFGVQGAGTDHLCPEHLDLETLAEVLAQCRDARQESGLCAHLLTLSSLPAVSYHFLRFLLVGEK